MKALVIMIVRRVHRVGELLAVLEEPTPEMRSLGELLTEHGRLHTRRTLERRLNSLPETLPARIRVLGRHLVGRLKPWAKTGRWRSTPPCCSPRAGCGTRRTERPV
jgi:hypothetical protein